MFVGGSLVQVSGGVRKCKPIVQPVENERLDAKAINFPLSAGSGPVAAYCTNKGRGQSGPNLFGIIIVNSKYCCKIVRRMESPISDTVKYLLID